MRFDAGLQRYKAFAAQKSAPRTSARPRTDRTESLTERREAPRREPPQSRTAEEAEYDYCREETESAAWQSTFDGAYEFEDKTLEEWIGKARCRAAELTKQSLDDLVGISKVAATEFFSGVSSGILFVLVMSMLAYLFF